MVENRRNYPIERREIHGMAVEALSVGKYRKEPHRNEDQFVVTSNTLAVIDGSAPRLDVKFDGKSGGRFAADVVAEVLRTTGPNVNGMELVDIMTQCLNEEIDRVDARELITETVEARSAALFTAARIVGEEMIITAVGDVHCRVNGEMVHTDEILSEQKMVEKRVAAMEEAHAENSNITDEELRIRGKAAITQDLNTQVGAYFNNPDDPLGLGIIDGTPVPEKFVKVYRFPLKDIRTLEIFSDGYCVVPDEPTVEAYEKAFAQSEKEDPLRWKKHKAVKTATPEQFSDDRTVVIAKKME